MIEIEVPRKEVARLISQVGAFEIRKRIEIRRLIEHTALQIENTTKDSLNRKGTGRVYSQGRTASGRKRTPHQASAPGEPPAVQTARLRNSITTVLERIALGADIGTNVEYARHLEFGTVNMEARPFLRPAFLKHMPAFIAGLKAILSKP